MPTRPAQRTVRRHRTFVQQPQTGHIHLLNTVPVGMNVLTGTTDTAPCIAVTPHPPKEPAAETTHPDTGVESREPHDASTHRGSYIEMLISSLLGLYASLVLSIEAITIAANPAATLSCDLSSTISCGAVGRSWQASLLGFPNAFLGLIAEAVVITVAVAAVGGVKFPRWFMLGAQVMYTAGFVFAYWLFTQSFFVIGRMCPWCLLITVTTTLVFASLTRVNILDGNFGAGVQHKLGPLLRMNADTAFLLVWFAVLAAAVYVKYIAV